LNVQDIVRQAEEELAAERHRNRVEAAKANILRQEAMPWWQRLIPFTIKIERRTVNV
jgi:hypothetical protein